MLTQSLSIFSLISSPHYWIAAIITWNCADFPKVMRIAKRFTLCWLAANSTFYCWPPTAPTKVFTIPAFAPMLWTTLSAFLATRSSFKNLPVFSHIMTKAKSFPKMRLPTFAKTRRVMNQNVLLWAAQLEIFKAIIQRVSIFVMNVFVGFQKSTHCLFHNKSMFKHPATAIDIGMIGASNLNISMAINFSCFSFKVKRRDSRHGFRISNSNLHSI